MTQLVQAIYSGLVLGAMYATMAMGLTLIWGSLRLLNLAHGALFTIGSYAAFTTVTSLGAPIALGPIAGALGAAACGGAIYLAIYRPLMKTQNWETTTLAAGLGVAIFVQAGIILLYSAREKPLPTLVGGRFRLPGDVTATGEGILIIATSLIVLLSLSVFLNRARHGIAIRALASNSAGAELVGIHVERLTFAVMVLGSGLAGLAGVLLASFYFVSPVAGWTALLKALIVTIAGGLGNLKGTIAAALLVGLLESSVSTWVGTRWSLPVLFGAIAVLLAVRPSGLAGKLSFELGR